MPVTSIYLYPVGLALNAIINKVRKCRARGIGNALLMAASTGAISRQDSAGLPACQPGLAAGRSGGRGALIAHIFSKLFNIARKGAKPIVCMKFSIYRSHF